VFFDSLNIAWEYEPQGFELTVGRYLPDFLLPDCGTWIEVKGHEAGINKQILAKATAELPIIHNGRGEHGPSLLVLGPIPRPPGKEGDWGWLAPGTCGQRYGFGAYHKNRRPWFLDNAQGGSWGTFDTDTWYPDEGLWTEPILDPYERSPDSAYQAARSARFEHGESG
jgi:hypothetical protein